MVTDNLIEVKHHTDNESKKESLVLYYNGENTRVGWKQICLKNMERLFGELKGDFPLLDIQEEFALVTTDLLIQNAPFLNSEEIEIATKKFMKHFKYTIKH